MPKRYQDNIWKHNKIQPIPHLMARQLRSIPEGKPFLKWAGGKTQLLPEFDKRFPTELKQKKLTKYVEPFIGGGAVYFYVNQKYSFKHCYICDINEELILSYLVIKKSVNKLIENLDALKSDYVSKGDESRKQLYYHIRDVFNQKKSEIDFHKFQPAWIERAAQLIFLNRTCYNGLFRVNQKGEFNVPFGKYKNPEILNETNLKQDAKILQMTEIILGDFTQFKKFVDKNTFVYLDPPYRPLNVTSSFTSYSRDGFSDDDQKRLAKFFRELDKLGAKVLLSNSDPKNENPYDTFFEDLYSDYTIERVPAKRSINCVGSGRGEINELIITNYRRKI
jgi:DNA adenine methylase